MICYSLNRLLFISSVSLMGRTLLIPGGNPGAQTKGLRIRYSQIYDLDHSSRLDCVLLKLVDSTGVTHERCRKVSWDGMPFGSARNVPSQSCLLRPYSAISSQLSAPEITAHTAITRISISRCSTLPPQWGVCQGRKFLHKPPHRHARLPISRRLPESHSIPCRQLCPKFSCVAPAHGPRTTVRGLSQDGYRTALAGLNHILALINIPKR